MVIIASFAEFLWWSPCIPGTLSRSAGAEGREAEPQVATAEKTAGSQRGHKEGRGRT